MLWTAPHNANKIQYLLALDRERKHFLEQTSKTSFRNYVYSHNVRKYQGVLYVSEAVTGTRKLRIPARTLRFHNKNSWTTVNQTVCVGSPWAATSGQHDQNVNYLELISLNSLYNCSNIHYLCLCTMKIYLRKPSGMLWAHTHLFFQYMEHHMCTSPFTQTMHMCTHIDATLNTCIIHMGKQAHTVL